MTSELSEFKVGDRVKLVGLPIWGDSAKKDIGKYGVIRARCSMLSMFTYKVYIEGGCNSGNKEYWWTTNGIEYTTGQLLFAFMKD